MTAKTKRTLPTLIEMQGRYQCKYCHKPYRTERGYLNHLCTQMKRAKEMTTQIGQMAWIYYQHWFKVQRLQTPTHDMFPKSMYYRTLVRFAQFVKEVKLFQPLKYIEIVTNEYGLSPVEWSHRDVYFRYIQYVDHQMPPKKRIERMVVILDDLADEHQCSVSEVLDKLTMFEIVEYVQRRDFTPWVLLQGSKFKELLKKCSSDQREIVKNVIPPNLWKQRFQQQPVYKEVGKAVAEELGI